MKTLCCPPLSVLNKGIVHHTVFWGNPTSNRCTFAACHWLSAVSACMSGVFLYQKKRLLRIGLSFCVVGASGLAGWGKREANTSKKEVGL